MAIDKNSTGFTLTFAVAMVAIVGTILALLAFSLQDRIKKNADDKKKIDILGSFGVEIGRDSVNLIFNDYVEGYYLLDFNGDILSDKEAEVLALDVKKQHRNTKLTAETKKYPIYKAKTEEGKDIMVVPMVGKGLWGPIWGYVAMEMDMTTVYGAKFDHKTETPGLGAEIKTPFFQKNWPGKTFDYSNTEGKFFEVTKGAGSASGNHQVDGITGGTITSKGVEEMVNRSMVVYKEFNESKIK